MEICLEKRGKIEYLPSKFPFAAPTSTCDWKWVSTFEGLSLPWKCNWLSHLLTSSSLLCMASLNISTASGLSSRWILKNNIARMTNAVQVTLWILVAKPSVSWFEFFRNVRSGMVNCVYATKSQICSQFLSLGLCLSWLKSWSILIALVLVSFLHISVW